MRNYTDYLRYRATRLEEFFNQCHSPDSGQFCEDETPEQEWTRMYKEGGISKEDYESGLKEITQDEYLQSQQEKWGWKEEPAELGGVQWSFEGGSEEITSAAQDIIQGIGFDPGDQYRAYSRDAYEAAETILNTLQTKKAKTDVQTYSGHHRSKLDILSEIDTGEVNFPLVATSNDKALAEVYAGTGENSVAVIYEFQKGSQGAWYRFNEYIQTGDYEITDHEWTAPKKVTIKLEQKERTVTAAINIVLANDCHDPGTGRFCEKAGTPGHDESSDTYHGADLNVLENTQSHWDVDFVKEALDSIAAVHGLPENFPSVLVRQKTEGMGNSLGVYETDTYTINMLDPKDQFTFIHEFGHHITLASPENPGYRAERGPTINEFHRNIQNLGMGNIYHQITSSEAIKRIGERAKPNQWDQPSKDGYASYLFLPHERFARAYAQYVASKSRNRTLVDQFERFRSMGTADDVQWSDEDFAPIAQAFDEYFSGPNSLSGLTASTRFSDYLRYRATRLEEFANPCHAPTTGQFCETDGPAFPSQDKQRPMAPKTPANYHQESEEWVEKLTPEEQKAAADYTGSYLYGEINRNAIAGTVDPRVDALDRAIEKAGTRGTPIRVYRRVGFKDRDAFLAQIKVGDVIPLAQPGAFQSASVTPRYPLATGWPTDTVVFEINARSGAAIGNVTQGGGTQKELELLLPRSARFKIVAIQPDVQFGNPPKTRGLGDTNRRFVIQVEEVTETDTAVTASITEFYNSCHAEDGKFCETHGVTHAIQKAAASDHAAAKAQVADKIAAAPVPSAASVKRARALANSSLGSQNSADRRRQRENLFKEFGGEKRGYVIDHQTGVKMHWTNDSALNPNQYPLFERGRIFTERQGGGYQLPNLIPELYDTNRARGDTPIRKENT